MSLTLLSPPDTYPITLSDVRAQTKTEGITADDDLITGQIIPAVVDRAEQATGRQWFLATWQLVLDAFPCAAWIEIPKAPLVDETVEITYLDANGVLRTWAASNFVIDAPVGPRARRGRVALAYGISWPSTLQQINAVRIEFGAGYGEAAEDVPPLIRQAMLLDAGTLYRQREALITGANAAAIELPMGSRSIYRSFRSRATQREIGT